MNDLPLLRDIHLPDPIGLFPLGYGSLLLMGLFAVFVLSLPYLRYTYLKSKKKYALDLLQLITDKKMKSVCQISELLRRICKIKHKKAVALYGMPWADFLSKTTSQKLSPSQMQILINAPYAPSESQISDNDFDSIKTFAKHWVETNL